MGKNEGCDACRETKAPHFPSKHCANQSSSKGKMGESQSEEALVNQDGVTYGKSRGNASGGAIPTYRMQVLAHG
jgi:hypothetical protein